MTAAPVDKFTGSQTMTVGTEHTLAETGGTNDLGTGVFVLHIDTSALVNGDALEVRAYSKVRTSDTARQEWMGVYGNVQSSPNKASTPLVVTAYGKFTVKQTAGTSRALPWSVMAL
jgi:hypothetical protein